MKKLFFVFILLQALVSSRADNSTVFEVEVDSAFILKTIVDGDQYTWLVRFPLTVNDNIVRVRVAQKNDWAEVPYFYYIQTLDERYFDTCVDNEFDTEFTAYGYTEGKGYYKFEFVFHPTPEMLDDFTTGVDAPAAQADGQIISVHTLSGKSVAVADLQSLRHSLPKGVYIVTFSDAKGNRTSRKLAVE